MLELFGANKIFVQFKIPSDLVCILPPKYLNFSSFPFPPPAQSHPFLFSDLARTAHPLLSPPLPTEHAAPISSLHAGLICEVGPRWRKRSHAASSRRGYHRLLPPLFYPRIASHRLPPPFYPVKRIEFHRLCRAAHLPSSHRHMPPAHAMLLPY